jgi:hypothetical protein
LLRRPGRTTLSTFTTSIDMRAFGRTPSQACSHWLGDNFGSIAAIVPLLPQSS